MVGVWGHEWLWKEKDTCQRYCRERTRQLTELEEEIEEGQAIKNDTEVSGQTRMVVPLTETEASKVWSCC